MAIDPQNTNNLYVESQRFGFKRSTDGGYNFEFALNGITEERQDFLFITPFVMDPNNSACLWAGGRRLWRTENRATSWVAAASTVNLGSAQVSAIAVVPGNSDLWWSARPMVLSIATTQPSTPDRTLLAVQSVVAPVSYHPRL